MVVPRLSKGIKESLAESQTTKILFHAFQQVKRYTTIRPKAIAGCELYGIARDLLTIHTQRSCYKVGTKRYIMQSTT